MGAGDCCLGLPSMGRRVAVRARLMHGLVEDLVEVGSLKMIREGGLMVGGIPVHVEMVFCQTRRVEVREGVDMKAAVHLVVGA